MQCFLQDEISTGAKELVCTLDTNTAHSSYMCLGIQAHVGLSFESWECSRVLHPVPGVLGEHCMTKYVGNICISVLLTNVKFWRRTSPITWWSLKRLIVMTLPKVLCPWIVRPTTPQPSLNFMWSVVGLCSPPSPTPLKTANLWINPNTIQ